ncbi:hypothetical protein [Amycolatopsis japonica]|uniref:hypothetical protein n=1 Tax=Amycolatopsis japonica TaxID=208439 RepID=UPI0033F47632
MADPLTLSVLGAAALTEGIKFVYNQATELLKRRREKSAEALDVPALEGELAPLEPDSAVLDRVEPDLRELRKVLQDYVDEIEPINQGDQRLLETTDAVRRLLEAVYRQRITFRGEQRPASGTIVEGTVDVATVSGYAAGVRARVVGGGAHVRGTIRVDEVTGTAVGVDLDRIGD